MKGRPIPAGQKAREILGQNYVAAETMEQLREWQEKGLPYGRALDELVRHAKATGFDAVGSAQGRGLTLRQPHPRRAKGFELLD